MVTVPILLLILGAVVWQVRWSGGRLLHAFTAMLLGMMLAGTTIGAPIQNGMTTMATAVSTAVTSAVSGLVH